MAVGSGKKVSAACRWSSGPGGSLELAAKSPIPLGSSLTSLASALASLTTAMLATTSTIPGIRIRIRIRVRGSHVRAFQYFSKFRSLFSFSGEIVNRSFAILRCRWRGALSAFLKISFFYFYFFGIVSYSYPNTSDVALSQDFFVEKKNGVSVSVAVSECYYAPGDMVAFSKFTLSFFLWLFDRLTGTVYILPLLIEY